MWDRWNFNRQVEKCGDNFAGTISQSGASFIWRASLLLVVVFLEDALRVRTHFAEEMLLMTALIMDRGFLSADRYH